MMIYAFVRTKAREVKAREVKIPFRQGDEETCKVPLHRQR